MVGAGCVMVGAGMWWVLSVRPRAHWGLQEAPLHLDPETCRVQSLTLMNCDMPSFSVPNF